MISKTPVINVPTARKRSKLKNLSVKQKSRFLLLQWGTYTGGGAYKDGPEHVFHNWTGQKILDEPDNGKTGRATHISGPSLYAPAPVTHQARIFGQILPILFAKFRRKIGEIWLNSSSQKMPGLMSYPYATVPYTGPYILGNIFLPTKRFYVQIFLLPFWGATKF